MKYRIIPTAAVCFYSNRRNRLLLLLFELMITISLLFYKKTATSLRSSTSCSVGFHIRNIQNFHHHYHPIKSLSSIRSLSSSLPPESSSLLSELVSSDKNTRRKNRGSFLSQVRSFVKSSSLFVLNKNRSNRYTNNSNNNTDRNMASSPNNNNNNDTTTTTTTTTNEKDQVEEIEKGTDALTITQSTSTTTIPATVPSTTGSRKNSRLVYGTNDRLFGCIEEQHVNSKKVFGNVLDAGTGLHSIRWLCTLPKHGMTKLTAITADKSMQIVVQNEINDLITILQEDNTTTPLLSHKDCNVLIGNWFLPDTIPVISSSLTSNSQRKSIEEQLDGEILFDTILADYLIGAMDGFSPYCQDIMIPKLLQYLNPNGGMLHIVGLQPLPDHPNTGDDPESAVICRVRQIRDACILLAGHRCYREYPVEWIIRQIEIQQEQLKNTSSSNNKRIVIMNVSRFPILYSYDTVVKQINVGRSKLSLFPNKELATTMERTLQDIQNECQRTFTNKPKIQLGFDYVVTISVQQQS